MNIFTKVTTRNHIHVHTPYATADYFQMIWIHSWMIWWTRITKRQVHGTSSLKAVRISVLFRKQSVGWFYISMKWKIALNYYIFDSKFEGWQAVQVSKRRESWNPPSLSWGHVDSWQMGKWSNNSGKASHFGVCSKFRQQHL